jgi:hypothetical protein
LPFDVDDPRLLPLCIGCVGLGVDVLHVELSVLGPHLGPACLAGDGGGEGVPLLLPVGGAFAAFPSVVAVPFPNLPLNALGKAILFLTNNGN